MKTKLTMMAGERVAREETFPTLEEADVHAASVREHSRGITQICYQLLEDGDDVAQLLGTWNKGSGGRWFYRAAEI